MGANFSGLEKYYGSRSGDLKKTTSFPRKTASSSQVIAFHSTARWKEHLESTKGTNKLMVIDFSASWCGPCRRIEPTINEFAAKYTDVDFIKIDVDELMDVAREYEVEAMPTFLFMKNGKVVDKVVGAQKEELQKKIEQHMQ